MPTKRATKRYSTKSKKSKKNFIRGSSKVLIGGAANPGGGRSGGRSGRRQQRQQQQQRRPNPRQPQQGGPHARQQQGGPQGHRGQNYGTFPNLKPGDARAFNQQFRGQKAPPDQFDPFKGMTREQRQQARTYESKRKGKSSGKTIDSYLKKIQKRMKKSFCRTKPACTQYPTFETKEMLKDFYDQLKSMNSIISKVNKSREMCKSIPADRRKSGMCA